MSAIPSAFVLVVTMVLCGCGERGTRSKKTLVIAHANPASGLDPATVTDSESIDVTEQIFEHLVRYAPESTRIEPALATRWELQTDGRTWRFFLRKGVRFHDGTPMNAAAVVYSFLRQDKDARTRKGRLKYPYWNAYFGNIDSVKRESDYVVRIVTKDPFAPLLASLAMFPVSIVSPKAFRAAAQGRPLRPVGTGPFKFVHRETRGDRITLEANTAYWGPKPKIHRLVFRCIPDSRQRLRALQSGLVQVARNLQPELLQLVRLHPRLRIAEMPANNVVFLAMNTAKWPFSDKRIRQAVNHAIRKDRIIGLVYQGLAKPAIGPLPPIMARFFTDKVRRYPHNLKQAEKLLQEAGYGNPRLGYPAGYRPKFLVMNSPRPYLPQPIVAALMIKRDLAAVGMQVDLQPLPFQEEKRLVSQGKHDLAIHGWSGDNGDPDNFLFGLLHGRNAVQGKALNFAYYNEHAFNEAVLEARKTTNVKERIRLYKKAQQIVAETAPWVPLVHAKVVIALRREVRGFRIHPSSFLDLRSVSLE